MHPVRVGSKICSSQVEGDATARIIFLLGRGTNVFMMQCMLRNLGSEHLRRCMHPCPPPKVCSTNKLYRLSQTERLLPIDLRGYSNLESAPPRLATRSNRAGNSGGQGVFEPCQPGTNLVSNRAGLKMPAQVWNFRTSGGPCPAWIVQTLTF